MRVQSTFLNIQIVQISNLIFAPYTTLFRSDLFKNSVVINIEPSDREIAFRLYRFFFDTSYLILAIDGCNAKPLRITDFLQKDRRAFFEFLYRRSDVIHNDIISEEQHAVIITYIILGKVQSVGNAAWFVLYCIHYLYLFPFFCSRPEMLSGAEKLHE